MANRTNIKLPANENFSASGIRKLRAAGTDVAAVIKVMPSVSAPAVMALLSEPQQLEGSMVEICQQNIRRRRFPALSTDRVKSVYPQRSQVPHASSACTTSY